MGEIMIGKVKVEKKDYVFEFSNNTLNVYFDNDTARVLFMGKNATGVFLPEEGKELPFEKLDGILIDGSSRVTFYFRKNNYGWEHKITTVSPGSWDLKVNIDKYLLYTYCEMREFTQISFYSKEFQKFLNMVPNISIKPFNDKMTSGKINFEFDSVNMKNEFKVGDLTYLIYPAYSLIWKGPEFDFTPGLSLRWQEQPSEKQILRLSEVMVRFIQYCFMRTNIYPEEINILTRNIKGSLHFCIGNIKKEKTDKYDIYRDALPWCLIYKASGNIISSIYRDEIHLLNLPSEKMLRLWVGLESISKDAAAFESEFDNLHPNGIPYSEERKNIEDEIVSEITPLMEKSASRKKKIYRGFIKHVHMESLRDKMEYALGEYSGCIETIKNRFAKDMSYKEIAEVCSNARNDIDHGNKLNGLDQKVVRGYIVIRGLIYAIQLSRFGMKQDEINSSINNLFLLPEAPYSR